MSKRDLKAAMDSLQVKKPLKLSASAPVFVAPQTLVEKPTPVGNHTRVENKTQVPKPTMVEKTTEVTNQTGVRFDTPVENRTQVTNSTQVPSSPKRNGNEQDSSVALEARASDALEKGYTRVPNTILMRLVSGDFTKNEIKIALIIARFTISFQRRHAPLSKAVLERQTGIRGAAVLEALSGLVAKGMVEKIQGDQHRPNQLGLVLPEDWDRPSGKPQSEAATFGAKPTPVENQTQVENPAPAPVGFHTQTWVGKPTYFKDNKIYINKNSLSLLSENLQKYFAELRPEKKRESEWMAFESLRQEYAVDDLSDCLGWVQKYGVGRGDELVACHSPMAFLSKAIGEVFAKVCELREQQFRKQKREHAEIEKRRKHEEADTREAAEWQAKEQAFLNAFPTANEQLQKLTDLLRGQPLKPTSQPGRMLAIGMWWDAMSMAKPA